MTTVTRTKLSGEPFDPWVGFFRWEPTTLTYSFPTDGGFYSYLGFNDVRSLLPVQKDAARAVFDQIESLTGLQFFLVSDSAQIEATLRLATEVGLFGGFAYLPDRDEAAGDAFFGSATIAPVPGNEAFVYFLHEIGHALGLDHGHEYAPFAGSALDSQEFSLMTYSDYVGDGDIDSYDAGPVDWAQGYMQLDIAALQFMYGANYAATGEIWSGDTVYAFDPASGEMSINGTGQGAPVGNRIFRTIWDGHGDDTYDLAAYDTDLTIDLMPGAFSTLAVAQLADLNRFVSDPAFLARGNIANALLVDNDPRGMIENAFGGGGNDVISGNGAENMLHGNAGHDRLDGLDGSDLLVGGAGRDALIGGAGNDTAIGGGGRDRIFGGRGRDDLAGGNGNDRLKGGGKADVLNGGAGFDILTGGAGRDRFVYADIADAGIAERIERIADFTSGRDIVDFSALADAPLVLVLDGPLSASGPSLSVQRTGADTRLSIDVDGDRRADMQIDLVAVAEMVAGDFIL